MAVTRGDITYLVDLSQECPEDAAAAEAWEAQRELMEHTAGVGDPGAIVEQVARLTGSPAVLQDRFLAVLATGEGPPGSPAADEIVLDRCRCPLVRDLVRDSGPGGGVMSLPRHERTPARLVVTVAAGGELLGFLAVAAAAHTAPILEAAAPVLALQLQAEERLWQLLGRDRRELFLDLLAGRSQSCLVLHGRRLGHDLERPHWPIVLRAGPRVRGGPDSPGVGGDPDSTAQATALEEVVREELWAERDRNHPLPVVGVDGDTVVVFLPDDGESPAQAVARLQKRARERGLAALGGWGPRGDALDGYGDGVTRAKWALDVLAVLPGKVTQAGFDDLGVYALLYEKGDKDRLWEFAHRWLGPLLDYDRLHAIELTPTLRVLLETGGPSAAASALFVHISTLKYRIRKIESILERDLQDPEVVFN
ncbi:MAG TPA: helix-turn-helix domain-containing protein, partial [Acidimicrobiia bacterium]